MLRGLYKKSLAEADGP